MQQQSKMLNPEAGLITSLAHVELKNFFDVSAYVIWFGQTYYIKYDESIYANN